MNRLVPMLRLTPQAAGELLKLARVRKEFDRQLAVPIGNDALRKPHKATKNALMLADLIKEDA